MADEIKDKGIDNLVDEIFSNSDKEWTEDDLETPELPIF